MSNNIKSLQGRARVIYQSEALYAAVVDATGYHFMMSSDGFTNKTGVGCKITDTEYLERKEESSFELRTGLQQLQRVQSANYSFSINRQDVNQFGQLARIDAVAIDPPTVNLDFSYYLTNGFNEKILGFDVSGEKSAITDEFIDGSASEMGGPDGKNFFILTTPQGSDAVNNAKDEDEKSVIAVGNGYVTNYSVEASVGGMPTANVTIEGLNIRSYIGTENLPLPSVNTNFGTPIDEMEFSVPAAASGVLNDSDDNSLDDPKSDGWSCLRPGDISLSLGQDGRASLFENLPSDYVDSDKGGNTPPHDYMQGSAHIQSFSIDIPVGRTPLQRLGSPYGYTRVVDYPINVTVSVSAILADLKEGNVADLIWDTEEHDLVFTLREPNPYGTGDVAMQYVVKGALLESESFSSSIGDNKTVDLTFNAQIGGPEDDARGVRILGSRKATNATWEAENLLAVRPTPTSSTSYDFPDHEHSAGPDGIAGTDDDYNPHVDGGIYEEGDAPYSS